VEKSYVANLGRNWQRQKAQERDASTPEGEYNVKGMKSSGKYGRALLLDYPNSADRQRFTALKRKGTISSGARIGGNIEIHGGGRADSDWTEGCISLNDSDMLELYERAYPGMPVSIVGSSSVTRTARGGLNASE
jgi:murein L,D-transpeptidase YafK